MNLDPKGIESAHDAVCEFYGLDELPGPGDIERAILAYLQATDSVVVPREATEAILDVISSPCRNIPPQGTREMTIYRAMIQAAEGK
ncbi:hypothetical protein [Roseibium sp.]|uniref:hypothetical protein n=1 Tax=Roseibium sp. TaxID=1936156 RepID=UPI003B52DE70